MLKDSSRTEGHTANAAAPWGPGAGILFSFVGFIVAQVLAVTLVGAIVYSLAHKSDQSLLETPYIQFAFVVLSDVMIIGAVWSFLKRRKSSFAKLGFGRRPEIKDLGKALLAYGIYLLFFIILLSIVAALTGVDVNKKQELGFDTVVSDFEKLLAFISLVLLPPFVEETLFRGMLFTGLRTKISFVWAAVVTSVLFAALHLLGSSQGLLWVAAIDTFILSLVLCYLREKTGALWASILLHMGKNLVAFGFYLHGIGPS